LRTATLARRWAALAQVDGELAYTLGLLGCVGQLVMRQGLPTQMLALDGQVAPFAPARAAAERAALGYCYGEVGARLAKHWQFPTLFAQVMGAQGTGTDNPQAAVLADLIELAAWQAWVTDEALSAEQTDALWPSELAQRVGVSAALGGSHFGTWDELCGDVQGLLDPA
jgi:HD-like signal output (HDOD) protein